MKIYLSIFLLGLCGIFVSTHGFFNVNKKKHQKSVESPVLSPPYFGGEPISLLDHSQSIKNQKPFVVIIPSYNNENFCRKNLESVFNQEYENFRVIYIDDCSKDKTFSIVKELFEKWDKSNGYKLIHNNHRYGAMANLYRAVHQCKPNEIVVTLDGDDWFAHERVLQWLNTAYSDGKTWLTYGQYIDYPRYTFGCNRPISLNGYSEKNFRNHPWVTSHLRTFYAGLFHKIRLDDFYYQNGFYQMGWDFSMMMPMIEMAWGHVRFIPDVLYIYNKLNDISDDKVNIKLQQYLADHIRNKQPYSITSSIFPSQKDTKKDLDIIIFSENSPIVLKKTLESLTECVGLEKKVNILFDAKNVHDEKKYKELQANFNVNLIPFSFKENNAFSFLQMIDKICQNEFILLSTDHNNFHNLDLKEALNWLVKAQANGMYLGLEESELLSNNQVNGPYPLVNLFDDIFSWEYECNSTYMPKAREFTASIYPKSYIVNKLNKHRTLSFVELFNNWTLNIDQKNISIFYLENKCSTY